MAKYINEYQQKIKNKIIFDMRHNIATKKSGFFMSLPIFVENLSIEGRARVQFILDNSNWNRQIKRKLFYDLSFKGKDAIIILPGLIPILIRPIKVQFPIENLIGNLIKLTGTLATKFINNNETGYLYFDLSAGQIKSIFEIDGFSISEDKKSNEILTQTDFNWKQVQELFNINILPENNSLAIENIIPAVYFSNPNGEKDGQDDLSYFMDYRLDFLADGRVRQDDDLSKNIFFGIEGEFNEQPLLPGFEERNVGSNETKKWYSGIWTRSKKHIDPVGKTGTLADDYLINRVAIVSAIQFKEYADAIEKEIIKLLGLIPSDNQKDGATNMMNLEAKAMLNADQSPLFTTLIIFENKLTELTEKIMTIDIQSGNKEFYSTEDIANLEKRKIKVLMESEVKEELSTEPEPEPEIIEPEPEGENENDKQE